MGSAETPRRLLLCEPGGYSVHHLLNPWMTWTESVDVARAWRQWDRLASAIEEVGGEVVVAANSSASGAMTFTRDTAVTVGVDEAIVLRNVGRRGDLEPEHVAAWLGELEFTTIELGPDQRIDGGNVVPTVDGWVIGIQPGASADPVREFAQQLRERTGVQVLGVPIRDPRYGHLDTAFADLCGRGWLAFPPAFAQTDLTVDAWETVLQDRPVIEVTADEAEALACNVVTVGDHVIGGFGSRIAAAIDDLGLHAVPVELDEFRKAGGGAHCLTLELDPVHRRHAVAAGTDTALINHPSTSLPERSTP
jgi:N-dimethylarginine dimethylaminohydrolase